MKNYRDSDYALNKYSSSIIYRFADGIVEITMADYLTENPGKTASDFIVLKERSDAIYLEQDRDQNAQTKKNESFEELEGALLCHVQSSEEYLVEAINMREKAERRQQQLAIAKHALGKLTSVQRRRYLLHAVNGLTTREIAEMDGVTHQSVIESLAAADKKIKKVLANT